MLRYTISCSTAVRLDDSISLSASIDGMRTFVRVSTNVFSSAVGFSRSIQMTSRGNSGNELPRTKPMDSAKIVNTVVQCSRARRPKPSSAVSSDLRQYALHVHREAAPWAARQTTRGLPVLALGLLRLERLDEHSPFRVGETGGDDGRGLVVRRVVELHDHFVCRLKEGVAGFQNARRLALALGVKGSFRHHPDVACRPVGWLGAKRMWAPRTSRIGGFAAG